MPERVGLRIHPKTEYVYFPHNFKTRPDISSVPHGRFSIEIMASDVENLDQFDARTL